MFDLGFDLDLIVIALLDLDLVSETYLSYIAREQGGILDRLGFIGVDSVMRVVARWGGSRWGISGFVRIGRVSGSTGSFRCL